MNLKDVVADGNDEYPAKFAGYFGAFAVCALHAAPNPKPHNLQRGAEQRVQPPPLLQSSKRRLSSATLLEYLPFEHKSPAADTNGHGQPSPPQAGFLGALRSR